MHIIDFAEQSDGTAILTIDMEQEELIAYAKIGVLAALRVALQDLDIDTNEEKE